MLRGCSHALAPRSAAGKNAPAAALAAGAVLLGVVAWLLAPENLLDAYDQFYALIWGRELAGGHVPGYEALGASTPHPLTVAAAALLSVLGDAAAPEALELSNHIAWATVVVACGAIGWTLLGPVAGVAGAVVVAANPHMFDLLTAASGDAYFVALAAVALAVEVRRPRAGVPVLMLLALAGLCRPEAWLFSLAYLGYLTRMRPSRDALPLAALAVSAPVVWMLSDLITTGEPLYSLTITQDGAELAGRPTGVGEIVPQLRHALGSLLDASHIVGGVLGFAIAFALQVRRALMPAAVIGASVAGFAALGVAQLPMNPRYLLLAAALLSAAAGWALVAWIQWKPESRRLRAGLAVAAAITFVLVVTRASDQWRAGDALRADQRTRGRIYADLETIANRIDRACDVTTSTFYVTSILAYHLDRAPDAIGLLMRDRTPDGLVVLPGNPAVAARFQIPPARIAAARGAGPGLAATKNWALAGACSG